MRHSLLNLILLWGSILAVGITGGCAEKVQESQEPEDLRPLLEPEFVMNEVLLLQADEGFDLTGDGIPNNGLALLFEDPMVGPALGGDPNEYIAKTIRRAEMLLLLDFQNFQGYENDKSVDIDILLGYDFDGVRSNNFDGSEMSVTCSSLTAEGGAESQFFDAEIKDGQLRGNEGSFRFLVSFSNTEVLLQNAKITGSMDPQGQNIVNGMIGGAVSFDDLEDVVENDPEIGPSFGVLMLTFLENQLDTDLDGDGEFDALSASFAFEAVPVTIDRDRPCE
ncbi:MAG: hypothetical protein VX278_09935 [Myxococcota bacterium]|nr:hypothetical protein [Myxococcota bacterium]